MTNSPQHDGLPNSPASLGEQVAGIIERLPPDKLSLGELLDVFSDEGLLLLTILLTLVFLIPVSIPGVSTVFGAAILLVGVSRLFNRPLWLPQRIKDKALPA
ncbi:MAG: exopolysaccharide biosynthesis protein, partial [Stenotrophomonas acidaminiphila]